MYRTAVRASSRATSPSLFQSLWSPLFSFISSLSISPDICRPANSHTRAPVTVPVFFFHLPFTSLFIVASTSSLSSSSPTIPPFLPAPHLFCSLSSSSSTSPFFFLTPLYFLFVVRCHREHSRRRYCSCVGGRASVIVVNGESLPQRWPSITLRDSATLSLPFRRATKFATGT